LVGVRIQPVAESGQVVVARVGEEAGVKIYRRDSMGERLESVNPVFPPVQGPIEIIGVVSWVHRNMEGKRDRVEA
jgi:SOS-response transcriptional repressor LexA